MSLPTLHLIAPFHTQITKNNSHCAFSGKSLRFSKMMHLRGYRVVEYSNAGSESEADEHVPLLTDEEFNQFYPSQEDTAFVGNYASIGERGWPTFNARLIAALLERLKPHDIVCHQFGRSHAQLVQIFPNAIHCEIGIGYPDKPFGAFRIFESEIWRAYHWGRDEADPAVSNDRGNAKTYSWVIPNYFDLDDWPMGNGSWDYALYLGRITPEKGMAILKEIIRADAGKTQFVFAGQGDFAGLIGAWPNVAYLGVLHGRERAEVVGNARCMLMPTQFIEPFGGAGVEGMLTGTPLVASSYGAFVETVVHGRTGFHCRTLADWIAAIETSRKLLRGWVRGYSRSRFSLETCAHSYDVAFRQMSDLHTTGWYAPASYSFTLDPDPKTSTVDGCAGSPPS